MTHKTAYSYNKNKEFVGECKAWESPLEKNVYHLPADATYEKPLKPKEDNKIIWNSKNWEYQEIPKPEPEPEPEKIEPTYQEKRLAEYGTPQKQLEFITEHGLEAWQARVEEIKKQIPKE